MIDYKEEITRIAREHINKADDAGFGMYNFDLWLDRPIQGKEYPRNIILQTYPYKENDNYGLVYLLCYYPTDKDELNWEHNDYDFFELAEVEKKCIFNLFKTEMEKTNNKTMETRLSNFVKKGITFEEKVRLMMDWEEDRASDGEYVYDLDDNDDARYWIEQYDVKVLHKCRSIGRYWAGGWQFKCFDYNLDASYDAWCVNEESMNRIFTDGDLLGEIEDRFKVWMDDNKNYNKDKAIDAFSNIYSGLIDFRGYLKAQEPVKYKWVAISDDKSFEDESTKTFDSMEDCYKDMRTNALEKTKWNTEYSDLNDCVYISYNVLFFKDRIIHNSYSGKYLYTIIESSVKFDEEYKKNMVKEINDYYF